MFTRVNPLGWNLADPFTPAQGNQLDIDHANTIDAVGGGNYAPATAIVIAGAGLQVAGASFVVSSGIVAFSTGILISGGNFQVGAGGTAQFTGPATFDNDVTLTSFATLTVAGGGLFNGPLLANAGITASGIDIPAGGFSIAAGIGSTFAVACAATFTGATVLDDGFTSNNTSTFNSTVELEAASTTILAGIFMVADQGHINHRRIDGTTGLVLDADIAAIGINDADDVYVPALTFDRTWRMSDAGAGRGSRFSIKNASSSPGHTISLTQANGDPIGTITPAGWLVVMFNGSTNGWRVQQNYP